ncbi:hypothetical protein DOTSEDRAFT_24936 [Dothistroma septosporum NZE10]|uniref:Methyltransferase domain-containing protein n=1 Tax=Dothistroma septosporum (strain NZE10 / CBS 128990) TaxID=675120 RepID=M2XKC2_DOTSN|nr:hypothetical protein DOTSEDRAFT_24936 [Dothistroma septosporum NZE10]
MQSTLDRRTYHETSSPYPLPNDATEHERLDLQNLAFNELMHGKPIHAPLTTPMRMLDIGCGTGFMLKHFASTFPSAETVLGIDLSPGLNGAIPPNVSSLKGDFHTLISHNHPSLQPTTFDYIFSRVLAYGMTDWPGYIRKAASLLKPGGWLEIHEIDFDFFDEDLNPMSSSVSWHDSYVQTFARRGADLHAGRKVEGLIQEAGLEEVRVERYRLVFGPWRGHPEADMMAAYAPKYLPDAMGVGFEGMSAGVRSTVEIDEVKAAIRRDLGKSGCGLHIPLYVVWGRKPYEE